MRHHIFVAAAAIAGLVLGPFTSAAQPVSAPSLATPQQAAALLDAPGLVVLHIGDKAEYDTEHLPRARHLEVRALSPPPQDGQLTLQMPPIADLESRLEALGIGDRSPVLVYMGKDWVSPTTRVVFTLDYAGLGGRTFIVDGGLPAWKAAGLPVTSEVPSSPARGQLTIEPRTTSIADLASVRASAGRTGHVVVDARAAEFYTGQNDNNGRIPRPGHVAGAVSVPYTSFLREDGRFKPVDEIDALLKAAGATPGGKLTTYCHIGQQATVPWLMARMLGYDVQLYDGSYEEWSRADATSAPVTTGPTP